MMHTCVMSSHKPIRIYMGGLILGVNTLYRLLCFFKPFPMVGKGLTLVAYCFHAVTTVVETQQSGPSELQISQYKWRLLQTKINVWTYKSGHLAKH